MVRPDKITSEQTAILDHLPQRGNFATRLRSPTRPPLRHRSRLTLQGQLHLSGTTLADPRPRSDLPTLGTWPVGICREFTCDRVCDQQVDLSQDESRLGTKVSQDSVLQPTSKVNLEPNDDRQ